MMTMICDGVKSFVTPDCAKCLYKDGYINTMNECPLRQCEEYDQCNPDCAYYTEEW